MDDKTRKFKQDQLDFRRAALSELYAAYTALLKGGVKAYMIDDRQVTRFDLPDLKKQIKELEGEIAALENEVAGGGSRKAVGVIPRDW